MAGISQKLEGSETVIAALGVAELKLNDATGLYEDIGLFLVASTQERFDAETDPEGSPWPASIRALVEGGKTLQDTANLKRSITFNADPTSVEVGTDGIYAAIHQKGGVIRAKTAKGLAFNIPGNNGTTIVQSVTMPRRAFLGIDEEDEKAILQLAANWIAEPLNGGGDDVRR